MTANYIKMIPLQEFDTSTLTADYQAVESYGLPHACYLVKFYNNSTEPVYMSLDGSTDMELLPPGYSFPVYAQSYAQKRDAGFWAAGTTFYIKGTASTGTFTVSGYYQPQI